VLAVAEVHHAFLRFARQGEKHGAYAGSYVIMPDHVHLFVGLGAGKQAQHLDEILEKFSVESVAKLEPSIATLAKGIL
jgi:hypothetical protein